MYPHWCTWSRTYGPRCNGPVMDECECRRRTVVPGTARGRPVIEPQRLGISGPFHHSTSATVQPITKTIATISNTLESFRRGVRAALDVPVNAAEAPHARGLGGRQGG